MDVPPGLALAPHVGDNEETGPGGHSPDRSCMQSSYRFLVTGRVQGVGFRQAAFDCARAMGVTGWVRNTADGRVEGVATHESERVLSEFRKWLHRGPPGSRVDELQWRPDDAGSSQDPPPELHRERFVIIR